MPITFVALFVSHNINAFGATVFFYPIWTLVDIEELRGYPI